MVTKEHQRALPWKTRCLGSALSVSLQGIHNTEGKNNKNRKEKCAQLLKVYTRKPSILIGHLHDDVFLLPTVPRQEFILFLLPYLKLIWSSQWGLNNRSHNLHKKAKTWRTVVVVMTSSYKWPIDKKKRYMCVYMKWASGLNFKKKNSNFEIKGPEIWTFKGPYFTFAGVGFLKSPDKGNLRHYRS